MTHPHLHLPPENKNPLHNVGTRELVKGALTLSQSLKAMGVMIGDIYFNGGGGPTNAAPPPAAPSGYGRPMHPLPHQDFSQVPTLHSLQKKHPSIRN